MKILFFDVETTGVIKDYKASVSDFHLFPRIIQLAWVLSDENGNIIESYCELIKPDNWEIPNEPFWIENGFLTDINDKLGVPIESALNKFVSVLNECDLIVAHNISFDQRIVGAEMCRLNLKAEKKEKFCTMMSTVNVCNIPGQYGKPKWPKLEELYDFLFSEKIENAHDALGDVKSTHKCFFELHRRQLLPREILTMLPVIEVNVNYEQ
jgi:DNA polymerase III subunit epsilon